MAWKQYDDPKYVNEMIKYSYIFFKVQMKPVCSFFGFDGLYFCRYSYAHLYLFIKI